LISLALGNGLTWLSLAGSGVPSGLIGAVYDPKTGDGRTVGERITLGLRGTPAQVNELLARLEEKIALVNRHTREGVGTPLYLRVSCDPQVTYYYTHILQASLEPKANSLAYTSGGSLGVDLVFTRVDHFEGGQVAMPLSNRNGVGVTGGLTVNNHADSGHDNFVFVDADDLQTELPAPLRLEVTNATVGGTVRDLWIGAFQYDRLSVPPQLAYEGESATGGTDVSHATCSGGAFKQVNWSDEGWASLITWSLSAANLSRCQGRAVLPILRLANAHAYEDLQLKLVLKAGGIILYEGAPTWADPQLGYVVFPALRLPPAPLSGVLSAQAQVLHLYGNKPNSDSYTLDLDDLQLLPQDAFSHYQGLVNLAQGDSLVDDAFSGLVYGIQGGYELSTHIPICKGLHVFAENNARLVFFWTNADGEALPGDAISVRAYYRRRKRVL